MNLKSYWFLIYLAGLKAQSLFTTLKKKYQRKRKELKESARTGTPEEISKAQKSYQRYEFFLWYDDFFQTRYRKRANSFTDKRNQHTVDINGESAVLYESITADNFYLTEGKRSLDKTPTYSSNREIEPTVIQVPQEEDQKTMKVPEQLIRKSNGTMTPGRLRDSVEGFVLVKSNENMTTSNERKLEKESNDDLFCKALAADLKDLPAYENCVAKNEIRSVVFKYQMAVMKRQTQTEHKDYSVMDVSSS